MYSAGYVCVYLCVCVCAAQQTLSFFLFITFAFVLCVFMGICVPRARAKASPAITKSEGKRGWLYKSGERDTLSRYIFG